jgi:hypothetical protein
MAIASDAQRIYRALMRRDGESLEELHQRLDEVVGQVMLRGDGALDSFTSIWRRLLAEIFPNSIKGKAITIAVAAV